MARVQLEDGYGCLRVLISENQNTIYVYDSHDRFPESVVWDEIDEMQPSSRSDRVIPCTEEDYWSFKSLFFP